MRGAGLRIGSILAGTLLGTSVALAAEILPRALEGAAELSSEHPEVVVGWHRATGIARFVRLPAAVEGDLEPARAGADEVARTRAFLARHAALFGDVVAERDLDLVARRRDGLGFLHLELGQFHRGVRVFGAALRAHFDAAGRLRAGTGTVVPGLDLPVEPAISAELGAERAQAFAAAELAGPGTRLSRGSPRLWILRRELERGRPGPALLVWGTEVGDGGTLRELVFVDARLGKVVDHLSLIADAQLRRAYSGVDQAPYNGIPDSWPNDPDWVEGDPSPTGLPELDGALVASADVYAFFAFLGRDSWDGEGASLDISWNHATGCPNASWNGLLASFCSGFAVHDVVVHEWGHAYAETTAGLIYRWQSGALSESYSDLWGELLDAASALPGVHDTDVPDLPRSAGVCSGFVPARLRIDSPLTVAGDREVGLAAFGAPPTATPTVRVVTALDGAGADPADACEAIPPGGALAGRIAFANRGGCEDQTKALHVQAAGAIGLVVGNTPASPNPDTPPALVCHPVFACDASIVLPVVSLALAEADELRGLLGSSLVYASIAGGNNVGAGRSVRWILGEDVRPLGPARDMWEPTCFGHPGRTTAAEYFCGTADGGGVHFNSGVPNHAFALLVDGGSYNGRAVSAIGRTRALHLYWRTLAFYLTPTSDFADQADALEAACSDLTGQALPDPFGGPPATMRPEDCSAVTAAIEAVELAVEPPCDFTPILEPDPPPACGTQTPYVVASADFESGPEGWVAFRRAVANPETFDPRDWTRVGSLPDGRAGTAFFAPDPRNGDCATGQGGDDDSGVLVLRSPTLVLPAGHPARLAFDHYVTTEATWDGGNVKFRLGTGPWQLVASSAYLFNDPNGVLREPQVNSNPMAGEEAFHGVDEGSNSGSWGTSIVDLSGLVPPETPFQVRFEFGTDRCWGSDLGWWVDDVRVSACVDGDPVFLDGFGTGDLTRWTTAVP